MVPGQAVSSVGPKATTGAQGREEKAQRSGGESQG